MVVWTWIFCFMGNSKNTTKKGPSTGRLASNGEVERKIKVRITLPFPSSFQIFFLSSTLGWGLHFIFIFFSFLSRVSISFGKTSSDAGRSSRKGGYGRYFFGGQTIIFCTIGLTKTTSSKPQAGEINIHNIYLIISIPSCLSRVLSCVGSNQSKPSIRSHRSK